MMLRLSTHKLRPIACPHGWSMGYLLWVICRKMAVKYWECTLYGSPWMTIFLPHMGVIHQWLYPCSTKGDGGFWMHCVHPRVRQSLDRLSGVYRKNIGSIIESLGTHTHYNDVIMGALASHITSLMIVYATVDSDADQRKHQSSTSLAFVRENTSDRWIPHTNGQ